METVDSSQPPPAPHLLPEETSTHPPQLRRSSILSDHVKQPLLLLWIAIIPQLVLLLLNCRDYQLVAGEMAAWQKRMSGIIGATELLLLVGIAALALSWRARGRALSLALCWPLLVAPILYLWLVTYQIGSTLLPISVTAWILPPGEVLYSQYTFMMPLIFYAAVRLSCADITVARLPEFSSIFGILLGIPILFYGVFRLPWRFLQGIPPLFFIITGVICTLAVIAAALRLLVTTYVEARKRGPLALGILSALVGIVGPIAGLLLNRKISFPADFQALPVYAMAITNGVLLLLPNFRHPLLHRVVWLAQCACFPFTFYFFLVFLPFLPLSIAAIVACGIGFLVLTPTALFLVHGQRILDGYRNEVRDGSRLIPALLGIAAISIIPLTYAINAVFDRAVLHRAIDYVYSPDYRADTRFNGNPALVQRSLEHLRDFKGGLNLPFLSSFYNWVVFDGLVLPDEKMSHIHKTFFGRDLAEATSYFFGPQARRRVSLRQTTPFPHDVRLVKAAPAVVHEGVCDRATISLLMQNSASAQSEFVATINLPEGVLVSGFWLHIGHDRVPGQLFEKKSALWVYQMIRDRSRRDPGLLLFTDSQTLELRVFPFADFEQREVEIEFLYPAALQPAIRIADETLHPSGETEAAKIVVTQTSDAGRVVSISPKALALLPHTTRTPYLHFIVDRSAGSDVTEQALADAILAARSQFPDAHECLITAANYEMADLTRELTPLDSADPVKLEALPRRGGFLPQRTMKRALLRYSDQLSSSSTGKSIDKFPIFIVVPGSHTELLGETDLASFAKFTPDLAGYYVAVHGTLEPHDFTGKPATIPLTRQPVALLKVGESIQPCAARSDGPQVIDFGAAGPQDELSVLDAAASHLFVPLTQVETIPPESRYAAGVAAWLDYLSLIYNPSRGNAGLADTVKRSRESGIMIGSTSFIVVENSAQWKMLERKQNQKLRNSVALEIDSVPEPSTWCLIAIGGGILLFFALRKSRSSETRLH